jgi:peptide-methionine (S)-S-oxide reductase
MIFSMIGASCARPAAAALDFKSFPEPKQDQQPPADGSPQTIVLAGGCFWCVEGVYEQIPGVLDVVSGYAGGTKESADYDKVSSGETTHAEVVQITYDPTKTSLGKLLKVFFSVAHDPTQLNMQGPDHGTQYRSAVFYANDDQKRVADAYIRQLNDAKVFDKPIATTLERLDTFYPAEAYHQDFARNNPTHGYIVQQAKPKVEKAKKAAEQIKKEESATKPG